MASFIEHLKRHLTEQTNYRIPEKSRQNCTLDSYSEKVAQVALRAIGEESWIAYFENCGWLEYPSQQDRDAITRLSDYELTKCCSILAKILGDYWRAELENTTSFLLIHEHYKVSKEEIARRNLNYPKENCLDVLNEKARNYDSNVKFETKLEQARTNPQKCPHCGNEDVRSYGKAEWKCHSCGKRWRKH